MGAAWYCKKCDQSKISISNKCVKRLINEDTKEPLTSDEIWFEKLKSIDENFCAKHGLTFENFNNLATTLESYANEERSVICKDRHKLLDCLERNKNCMIKCFDEMAEFIDCVDAFQINRIKEKYDQEVQERRRLNPSSLL